eukprot:gnl/MRDRNA2_/MRDRNA2_42945_c0_seq1.p1 gnl/MRDRNA2_/MRDRNA2_42945_c0~~gnl/MRDRNA2_/MRDRNA2_42945_c0_seq1.p1  ORF type:complete len:108 (+),score=24.29 gnl/MRDRNA2_/MRDRNA2_42945_c0_seq1:63-386(+)
MFAMTCLPDEHLFAVLTDAVHRRMVDFNAHSLANAARAFLTVGRFDVRLFLELAREAQQCQAGSESCKRVLLITALAKVAARCVDQLDAGDLANMAWAFALAGHSDE